MLKAFLPHERHSKYSDYPEIDEVGKAYKRSAIIIFFGDSLFYFKSILCLVWENSHIKWILIDSIAASVFAHIFVQLTITIYQFNHYIFKYWAGCAVWILHKNHFWASLTFSIVMKLILAGGDFKLPKLKTQRTSTRGTGVHRLAILVPRFEVPGDEIEKNEFGALATSGQNQL